MEVERERVIDSMKLEPPRQLRRSVLLQIQKEEYRRARTYLFVSFTTVLFSASGALLSLWYMTQEFYQSSFYHYSSLVLSDTDVVRAYWKELILSLAESFPLFGLIVSLIAIVVSLASIRAFVSNLRSERALSFSN